jgi:hypothetical protein
MWVREHIRVVVKTMSFPSCLPSQPLLALFFLAVESFRQILAISFSVLKSYHNSYLARFAREQVENQMVCADRLSKMVVAICLPACHNIGSLLAKSSCPRCFDLAPKHFSGLKFGPVKACHLTRHAVDGGDAPRFSSWFWQWAFSVSMANLPSAPPPLMPTVSLPIARRKT